MVNENFELWILDEIWDYDLIRKTKSIRHILLCEVEI